MTEKKGKEIDFESVPQEEEEEEVQGKPKKRGRPKKTHDYVMVNGIIDAKRIFLYVPPATVDPEEIDRFLEMCDRLLIELGPKSVTEIDIKDVASLFRDTVVRDKMYEGLKACANLPDKSMMVDLSKMSAQLDVIQKSLKVRAADREKERTNSKDLSMIEIIDKYKDDDSLFAMFDIQQKNILDKYYSNPHTDVDEYMSIRAPAAIQAEKIEEEEDQV